MASVEIPVLLTFFTMMLTGPIYTNLIIYRTCYTTLGYNETECALLGNAENHSEDRQRLEKLVEPTAAIVNTLRGTIEGAFSSLMCMFIGPWSDKYGRKVVLIVTMCGFTLNYFAITIFSVLTNISPWFSILGSIPLIMTGGAATYLTVMIAYVTDSSNEDNRGTRMAVFEGVLSFGILLGNITGPYLFYATSYPIVFLIAALTCLAGVLHLVLFVPESLANVETEGKLRSLFRTANLRDMLKTAVKSRSNHDRSVILLCVAMMTTYIFIIYGDGSVTFYFLRSKFDWSLTKYQLYSSAHNVVWILGTVLATYVLHKTLKVTESVLALMGLLSMMDCSLMLALATADWHIYASITMRLLGGMISPMVRSFVSKRVEAEEVGKIFSMITASEVLFGLGASPLYTFIYNTTINRDPGIFNYLSVGLYGFASVLIITVMYLRYATVRSYDRLLDEVQVEGESMIN